MRKRKRKYPSSVYIVNAPFVQKNYNQHKCAVDKWNKALLEYYRLAWFVNDDDVMYTQFFFHAFTCSGKDDNHNAVSGYSCALASGLLLQPTAAWVGLVPRYHVAVGVVSFGIQAVRDRLQWWPCRVSMIGG